MLIIYFDPLLLKIKNLPSWVENDYNITKDKNEANIVFTTDALDSWEPSVEYFLVQSADELKSNFKILLNDNVHIIEPDLDKKRIIKRLQNVGKNIYARLNKELFALPLKIKSDEMLIEVIRGCALNLEIKMDLEIFVKTKGLVELKRSTDTIPKKLFAKILETTIEKPIIGNKVEVQSHGKFHIAFPFYEICDQQSWMILTLCRKKDFYFFSENFFKYIENTLIYRKSLDKQIGFKLLSDIDDVTGLFNQRKLMRDLEHLIQKYENTERNFSVMFIDVDHFKKVNDNYGHIIGSQILVDIGVELKKQLRGTDLIYRYGGDEFVVVMPNVTRHIVHTVAKRILDSIKAKEFFIKENERYNLTISIGLAEYPIDALSVKEIIRFADEMMYISKNTGRGKIFHISEVK